MCRQFNLKKTVPHICYSTEKTDKTRLQTVLFILYMSVILLILCGDIELNPGPNTVTDLRIIHINTCSLKNKIDLIEAEYRDVDIITVSETWLSDAVTDDQILLRNFHPPIRQDRQNDPHGGVAIYVRNNLCCKRRHDLHVVGLESVWVETRVDQARLFVGSFYRPPNSNINYWTLINESIRKVNNLAAKFLILGDFNTNYLSSPSPHLLDLLNQYNLTQLVHEPTRVTELTSSCLDLVITQSPNMIKTTSVLPNVCSDHSVPCVVVKNPVFREKAFKRTILNYHRLDIAAFCSLLEDIHWNEIIYTTP